MAKKKLRQYELIYIIQPEASDEEKDRVSTRIKDVIERFDGSIVTIEEWGKRKLAYEIRRYTKGVYYYYILVGMPGVTQEIERNLKMFDACIRYLTVRLDDSVTPEAALAAGGPDAIEAPEASTAGAPDVSVAQEPVVSVAQEPVVSVAQEPVVSVVEEPEVAVAEVAVAEVAVAEVAVAEVAVAEEPEVAVAEVAVAEEPEVAVAEEPEVAVAEEPEVAVAEMPAAGEPETPVAQEDKDA